jgi:hypothetical protein
MFYLGGEPVPNFTTQARNHHAISMIRKIIKASLEKMRSLGEWESRRDV